MPARRHGAWWQLPVSGGRSGAREAGGRFPPLTRSLLGGSAVPQSAALKEGWGELEGSRRAAALPAGKAGEGWWLRRLRPRAAAAQGSNGDVRRGDGVAFSEEFGGKKSFALSESVLATVFRE